MITPARFLHFISVLLQAEGIDIYEKIYRVGSSIFIIRLSWSGRQNGVTFFSNGDIER